MHWYDAVYDYNRTMNIILLSIKIQVSEVAVCIKSPLSCEYYMLIIAYRKKISVIYL